MEVGYGRVTLGGAREHRREWSRMGVALWKLTDGLQRPRSPRYLAGMASWSDNIEAVVRAVTAKRQAPPSSRAIGRILGVRPPSAALPTWDRYR